MARPESRRILILSCSSRKRHFESKRPALDVYDGSSWRVVRAHIARSPQAQTHLNVFAISAKYGLIPAEQKIDWYDETVADQPDHAQVANVRAALAGALSRGYGELGLAVSKRYLPMLGDWESLMPSGLHVSPIDGPIGIKLGRLKAWLERREWRRAERGRIQSGEKFPGVAHIGGNEYRLSREQVAEAAMEALKNSHGRHTRYRNWYVRIGEVAVSAKWLVSVVTGLPTSRFDAATARRALQDLGFDIEFRGD